MTTNGRHYAVSSVFPPKWLHDRRVREPMVAGALRSTAEKIEGIPRDRPWRIGNIRYGAFIVPHDLTRFTYRAHPLDGKLVAEADIDQLLDELALATEVGEINHLGTWAVEAFGDVIFEPPVPASPDLGESPCSTPEFSPPSSPDST